MQQNKTTLVQSPVAALGQEMTLAYSTTLPSPQALQSLSRRKNTVLHCAHVKHSKRMNCQ